MDFLKLLHEEDKIKNNTIKRNRAKKITNTSVTLTPDKRNNLAHSVYSDVSSFNIYKDNYSALVKRVKLLLEKGANPNYYDGENYLIFLAVDRGYVEILQLLLEFGANPNVIAKEENLLYKVATNKLIDTNTQKKMFELLVGADINLNMTHNFLHISSCIYKNCSKEIYEFLVANGMFDTTNQTLRDDAFVFEEMVNQIEICKSESKIYDVCNQLLQKTSKHINQINPDSANGNTSLHAAAQKGFNNLTSLFMSKQVNANPNALNAHSQTPLISMLASKDENSNLDYSIAQMLINAGADLNAVDCDGRTALMHAFLKDEYMFAKYLIQCGADCSVLDNFGKDAYDYCLSIESEVQLERYYKKQYSSTYMQDKINELNNIIAKSKDVNSKLEYALAKGGDIDAKDSAGNTLFLNAVLRKNYKLISYALKHGADVNETNNFQHTALIQLIRNEKKPDTSPETLDIIEHLLKCNADVNYMPTKGNSAIFEAINLMSPKITQLLLKHGADLTEKGFNELTPVQFLKQNTNKPNFKSMQMLLESSIDKQQNYNNVNEYEQC